MDLIDNETEKQAWKDFEESTKKIEDVKTALEKHETAKRRDSDIKDFENGFERSKRKSFFNIAKENAENRLFKLITLSADDIMNFFEVYRDDDGNGVAKRQEYEWIYKTEGKANEIPLDNYIVPPTKFVDGEKKEIKFFVSFFFKDTQFLKRCKDYYKKYNIDFRIIKLKRENFWKIILKVSDPKNVIFKT